MKSSLRCPASILIALLALVPACREKGDPARACLDSIVKAAHDRDAEALFSRVAADFQSGDGSSRAEAEFLVRRYFAAYENLDVTLSRVTIERSENAASARFHAALSGRPRKMGGLVGLFPSSSTYVFDLRLVAEKDGWKVAWAQWRAIVEDDH